MKVVKIREEELYDVLVNDITELFHTKCSRKSLDNDDDISKGSLGITFCFYKTKDNIIKMQVYLKWDKELLKFYYVDKKASFETIYKLMNYLFLSFSFVEKFENSCKGVEIVSLVKPDSFGLEGTVCEKVKINFNCNLNMQKEFKDVFLEYFNFIIVNFESVLSNLPWYNELLKSKSRCSKKQIVYSLSRDEIMAFVNSFELIELKNLLIRMDTKKFFFYYNVKFKSVDDDLKMNIINGCVYPDLLNFISSFIDDDLKELLISMNTDKFFELYNAFEKITSSSKKLKLVNVGDKKN